jgi:hypothetical protein
MSLISLPGQMAVPIGPSLFANPLAAPGNSNTVLDAALEAQIMIGQIVTADGASHTIDTSGSSNIQWRAGTVTFANAGTSVKVGIGAVDTANGPPGRAVNVADLITFDVSKTLTGGGGGITTAAWQTHVPDSGSKTIANGDLVALSVQMITRGGADVVNVQFVNSSGGAHLPEVTDFTGGAYSNNALGFPDAIITFSDGTLGYFFGTTVQSSVSSRTYNSSSSPSEYGQLFSLPFAVRVSGLYGWVDPDGDFDLVLYSDPLGTPVAQRTASFDANWVSSSATKRLEALFATPYDIPANTPFALVVKPAGTSITISYKTLANAAHRIVDPWGLSGYGVSRSGGSGAFANANSSLEHYFIGLFAGGFDAGGGPATLINGGLVR